MPATRYKPDSLAGMVSDAPNEWRADTQTRTFRLSLRTPGGSAILPLFVHVSTRNGRITAELESDQTDYNEPGNSFNIRRARISNLAFWKDALECADSKQTPHAQEPNPC